MNNSIKCREIIHIRNIYKIIFIVIILILSNAFIQTINKSNVKFENIGREYSKGWHDEFNNEVDLHKLNKNKDLKIGETYIVKKSYLKMILI